MRRIEEESERMRVLVDELLLLARLDERRDIEPTDVDLAVLAADACSDAVAADSDRPITLDAPRPLTVAGVPDQLRQAIANCLHALTPTPPNTDRGLALSAPTASSDVRDHALVLREALLHLRPFAGRPLPDGRSRDSGCAGLNLRVHQSRQPCAIPTMRL